MPLTSPESKVFRLFGYTSVCNIDTRDAISIHRDAISIHRDAISIHRDVISIQRCNIDTEM